MLIDPKWGNPPLPIDQFRPGQEELIDDITERFTSGAKIVFLQAPTGIGKSVIGEGVRRRISGMGVYTCSTKALQEQLVHDFTYGKVLKGRANYLTLSGSLDRFGRKSKSGQSMVTAADCTYTKDTGCRWCPTRTGCPYFKARREASTAELAILNTSYFLTETNKGQGIFAGRDLCVLDEADLLEGEVLNQVEVFISKQRMDKLNIDPPSRKTVESVWAPWVDGEAIPKVKKYLEGVPRPYESHATPMDIKEYNGLVALLDSLKVLSVELATGGWVYDGYKSDNVIFRPIEVNELGRKVIWPNAKRFLLMSATILSADRMADALGVDDTWDFIDVKDSPFPVENRPIYVVPVADVTNKLKDEEWPKLAQGIGGVLARHPTERILVHCVSYELANYLYQHTLGQYNRPLHIYTNTQEKLATIAAYRREHNSVIFAASMDRGIDLPGDLCRVQIVAKIPFGNLTDKRIQARMKNTQGGYTWYKMNAIRSLVQMTGRGVRSTDDWAVSYILDKQFMSNIMASKYLLPVWWRKALRMDLSPRKLMKGHTNA